MGTGPLRLIEGGRAAAPKRRRAAKPWAGCSTCAADVGIRTRVVVRAVLSPDQDAKGNITGGQKALVCAACLARGKVTPLTA